MRWSSDSPDSEQTESLNYDIGSYDPNNGGRWTFGAVTDLSTINASYTAQDGATITLLDATINGVMQNDSYWWAGLSCLGDATIILEGTNTVKASYRSNPSIYVPYMSTLTIKGDGSL